MIRHCFFSITVVEAKAAIGGFAGENNGTIGYHICVIIRFFLGEQHNE
jgi:hypothetical protein